MASPTSYHSPSASSYRSSKLNPHTHHRSGSSRDTAYNGSEGLIDGPDYFDHLDISTPPKAATPARPAFGARLLSSLSNAQPAAAALGRKGSVLHSRAKSLAAYVPKLSQDNAPTSPKKVQTPHPIFGDLFNGESAPVRGISPSKEVDELEFMMEYVPSFTERPALFKRRDTADTTSTQTSGRKASWFTRRPTTSSTTPSRPQPPQDELASLNISAALFPNGPADPLNPASFNDLLLNATELLQRMQAAYKEKIDYIASIQPEMDAQKEEVEEAETRSKHLKLQLEDLSRKSQEQEEVNLALTEELAKEKGRVIELRENAARSLRLVHNEGQDDEETPARRGKRQSGGSTREGSDSGFESDMDSIFSGNSSSVDTPLTSAPGNQWRTRDGELQRRTSTSTVTSRSTQPNEYAAWSTVEVLRSENQQLKSRVVEMEKEMQNCIDFVGMLEGT